MGARYVGAGSVRLVERGSGAGERRWGLVRGAARALMSRSRAALLTVVLALVWAAPAAASDVYVANADSNDVSQYDVGAGGALAPKSPATVAAGTGPFKIAVSPDGSSVYVTNLFSDDVSQYDVGAGGALSPKSPPTVPAGHSPRGIAVSPDGQSVYVTNTTSDDVSQYDVGAGGALTPKSPATVDGGSTPAGIAVSPDGSSVYVAQASTRSVLYYAVGVGGALEPGYPVPAGLNPDPYDVAVSPDGKSVYVPGGDDPNDPGRPFADSVWQYDTESFGEPPGLFPKGSPNFVAALPPGEPLGIAVSPDGHSVYVAIGHSLWDSCPYVTPCSNAVAQYVADAAGTLPGLGTSYSPPTVAAGNGPRGVVVSPDGSSVYVTNSPFSDDVSQYDVGAGGALSPKSPPTVPAGTLPHGIAVRPTLGAPPPPPPPAPTIGDAIASVQALKLEGGIKHALLAKLTGAQRDLAANNHGGACGKLGAFINQVQAHSAKKIPADAAQALIDQATALRQSAGCGG